MRMRLREANERFGVASRRSSLARKVLGLAMRALDAMHVASSMTFQAWAAMQIPFVRADERQREAGAGVALEVIWIDEKKRSTRPSWDVLHWQRDWTPDRI